MCSFRASNLPQTHNPLLLCEYVRAEPLSELKLELVPDLHNHPMVITRGDPELVKLWDYFDLWSGEEWGTCGAAAIRMFYSSEFVSHAHASHVNKLKVEERLHSLYINTSSLFSVMRIQFIVQLLSNPQKPEIPLLSLNPPGVAGA